VTPIDDENELLRSVALKNANAITVARQRAENDLLRTQEALRRSQERLTSALAAAGTGTFRWNIAANTVEGDDSLDRLFGLEPAAAPVRPIEAFVNAVHPDDRAALGERLQRCARDGADFDMEFRVVHRDGTVRWLADRARAVFDDAGRPVYMTGACTDITGRKQAEQGLREEARLLELLNRTGAILSSTLDLEAVVQAVTDAATELSGAQFGAFFYNTTSENGEAFLLFTLSGAPRAAFERFGNPRATALFGPTFHGGPPIRCADVLTDPRYGTMGPHHGMPAGHLPVRSYLAVPVRSRSGAVLGGLFFGHPQPGVFTERTEQLIVGVAAQAGIAIDNARLYEEAQRMADERQKLLERERSARAAAEDLSRLKDEFLTTLSHELRTPLNAILGWAHLLRRGTAAPEDIERGLETIDRNARAQARLIDELLDMGRITSGKLRLEVQTIAAAPFIDDAMESIRPAAAAKSITLVTRLDPAVESITADPGRLHQVIWNLLTNAIKFTPREGRVDLTVTRVGPDIELAVSDNGIGIDAQLLPLLFERFRQGDPSTTRTYGGLGLGLSIVKHIVELHGGQVRVDSAGLGMGTTVRLSLPTQPR
jgi:PAS domain S-box-containing protein